MYEVYCVICGNTYWNDGGAQNRKWMTKCMFLIANNDVITDCTEVENGATFVCTKTGCKTHTKKDLFMGDPNVTFEYTDTKNYTNKGVFIHKSCHAFVKKTTGISLRYSDLPIHILKKQKTIVETPIGINYEPISNYWSQSMDYEKMITDGNEYLTCDPLKNNAKNTKRLLKILNLMKIKNHTRKGPSVSATMYKNGDVKLGNDRKFWIKSADKWTPTHEKVLIMKYTIDNNDKNKHVINEIPQLGEYNTKLLFMRTFTKNKKTTLVEIVGGAREIETLNKLFL